MVMRPCCVLVSAPALSFPLVVPGADVAGSGCDAGGGGFALAAAEEAAAAAGAADAVAAAAASAGGCGGTAAPAPAASLVLISRTALAIPSFGNYSYFHLFLSLSPGMI